MNTTSLPTRLKYNIEDILENTANLNNVELEIKIRDKRKDTNIDLLEEKLSQDGYLLKTSQTIDYYLDGDRITYDMDSYYKTTKVNLIEPKFLKNNYDLKITLAKESLTPTSMPKNYTFSRTKNRRSYTKNNISVDITEVQTVDKNNNSQKSLELELEVQDIKLLDFKVLENVLEYVIDILFNSSNVIQDFTRALGRESDDLKDVYFRYFSRARDLEWPDLKNDGILKPFTISLKAEGITSFLYFHKTGIYILIQPFSEMIKISPYKKFYENFVDSIYVGELISKNNLVKPFMEDFLYLPYDCLFHKGINISRFDYLKRFSFNLKIYNLSFGEKYKYLIREKPIVVYKDTSESFFTAFNKIYDSINKVIYKTDGFIFTPIFSSYITEGQKFNTKKGKRVLSNFLDVLKYKLPKDLTIDLLIKEDGVYAKDKKFVGSLKFPVKKDSFVYTENDIGKIIEFKPIFKNNLFSHYIVFRDRSEEKKFPNSITQININWGLVHKPILIKTLLGKEVQLLRKYHGQIKENIIENTSGYTIDIGSGKGGDLNKYLKNKKLKEILFVEPNKEFLEEFKRRRNALNLGDREYKIMQAGGEESMKIFTAYKSYLKPKIKDTNENLNINMMISLSFFWKDKAMLEGLAKTINLIREDYKGKVYFNFLTINGEPLKRLFMNRGRHIRLNNIELIKTDDNEVFINIKESATVHDQIEYFVELDSLWEKIDFYPEFLDIADGENKNDFILSENEKTYSKLFVYGKASYIKEAFDYKSQKVDTKLTYKKEGKILAKGDDNIIKAHPILEERLKLDNLYRISTLGLENSLYHAVLKTLNASYRKADLVKRLEMAKKFTQKDKDTFLNSLPVYTTIISENNIEHYGEEKRPSIYLLETDSGYEPLVNIVGDKIKRLF